MRHLAYNVRQFAVPITSSQLTIKYNSLLKRNSFKTTQNVNLYGVIIEFEKAAADSEIPAANLSIVFKTFCV
jgi:hypothetical protein